MNTQVIKPRPVTTTYQYVMSAIANVDTYFTKGSFKNWVTSVTFQIVGSFVKVTNTWNVVLAMLANNVTIVSNNNNSVPNGFNMSRIYI